MSAHTAQIVEIQPGASRLEIEHQVRVPVRVHLLSGEVLRGVAIAPELSSGQWLVETGHRKHRRRIAMDSVRLVAFPDPERAAPVLPAAGPATLNTPFLLRYRDGKTLRGESTGFTETDDGLIFTRVVKAGGTEVFFVSMGVLTSHRLGEGATSERPPAAPATPDTGTRATGGAEDRDLLGIRDVAGLAAALADPDDRRADRETNTRLGELLVAAGALDEAGLQRALRWQSKRPELRLGEVLQELDLVSAVQMKEALARRLRLPAVDLKAFKVEHEALLRLGGRICRRHLIFPLAMVEGHLVVATADPCETDALGVARLVARCPVEIALATTEELRWAIAEYYGSEEQMESNLEQAEYQASQYVPSKEDIQAAKEAEQLSEEQPVVRLLDTILRDAVNHRASDVHFRPTEKGVDLLYRIDGQLLARRTLARELHMGIVGRLKVMGRMNSAERHVPQDGRMRLRHEGHDLEMRLSMLPTVNGESVVIRLLNPDSSLKDFDELGFTAPDREILANALSRSHGMVLVTGPTGSGKSSTLYAALQNLATQNLQVISVEDPVEYQVEGVEQIPVNRAKDLGFSTALRAILRHDPDAIMVGEIRDAETAKIAVESALTGHLVLSTVHTNSAAAALVRLEDMGVEPYLLSPSLQVVIAQRLVRRNCPDCQSEEPVDPKVRRALDIADDEWFQSGRGCRTCDETGFYGRCMVYELMSVSPEIREAVLARKPATELNRIAMEQGMVRLTDMALTLARQGEIPLAEVYRVRID